MGKTLTADLILLRAKTDKLTNIKNLNLWGNQLDNVKVLRGMCNVEVLSLSVNKIGTLQDFAHCTKLTELYLRKNSIVDLREVNYLANLKYLRVLWLWDNPCSDHPLYRPFIIKMIPNLVKLDNTAITQEQRVQATRQSFQGLQNVFPPVSENEEKQNQQNGHTPYGQQNQSSSQQQQSHQQHQQHHHHHQQQQQMIQRPEQKIIHDDHTRQSRLAGAGGGGGGGGGLGRPHPPPPGLQHQSASHDPMMNNKRQGWQKRPTGPNLGEPYSQVNNSLSPPPSNPIMGGGGGGGGIAAPHSSSRNQNILCAVLALLKELDSKGLELVKRDIDRKLGKEL